MSTGQALGAVAGGVAGFFLGGPAGALQGATWGAALGGVLDPPKGPTVSGPRLNDLSWQQSAYGANIPRIYGTVAISGNVVWLEHNKLKEKVKKKKSGGKGGGSSTTTKTYTYYATFALMLCQGEVAGVRRIWCGDKLIYNAGSDDLETIIASNQAAKGWKLYTGTDDQLPDPRYEADVGVGNAPAFRGYTYIAFYDFALADYSNTLQAAQFKVELLSNQSVEPLAEISVLDAGLMLADGASYVGIVNPLSASLAASWAVVGSLVGTTAQFMMYQARENSRSIVPLTTSADYVWALSGASESDFAVSSVDGAKVLVGGTSLALPAMGSGISQRVHQQGSTYIVHRFEVGDVLINGISGISYSAHGKGFALNDGYVYYIDNSTNSIVVVDVASMTEVDIVPVDFTVPALTSRSPAAVDSGIYWFLDDIARVIYGVDVATGEKRYQVDYPYVETARSMVVRDGILAIAINGSGTVTWKTRLFKINDPSIVDTVLGDVVEAECSLSNLVSAADVDVSALTQVITGARIPGGTIRSAIEPMQGAYPFDFVPSGFKLKAVPRGQSPVVTIPWEDLAAANGDEIGDSLPYSREMDSQLPQKVTITALSSTREYGSATQSYERLSTSAVNVEQREIPLVLSDDEIAQMAEKLLFLRWMERDDFSFSLPPTYLALEPADVVTVQAKFGTFELRLTEINYEADGRLTCKAKANSAPLYTSRAVGAPGPGPDGTVVFSGPSFLLLLDIPTVDETIQNAPGFVGVMGGYNDGWPGGVAIMSNDGGQTWNDLQGYTGEPTFGTALTTLPASNCTVIDQRSLQVSLLAGGLESITRDQMLAGQHYVAYGADGRWEIMRFQTATLQTNGTYLVSGFVRGERGTEWATGLHQLGDWFVFLDDPDNAFIGAPVESIGLQRLYRPITSGATLDSAANQAFTYRGVNLECLSPVYARGARDVSSNFTGTFTRRSRLSSSWWTNGVVAPVGEVSESYEIDVMSGSTVKRTISATSPAWAYSAANQTTDFGSPQSSITFRIYQLSGTVGRGYPLEVTL
ncbi:hypothetical protein I5I61_18960 [Pseudomonas nitroreducens]|uniref:Tip attachment protein J domain-containing protein n=1 Tax=Pseudomonas nitroreducens TaxID=46680 RepID=A0ABS0KNF7_PSENT|nr:phage tail protein [Pseudomonas nitroreducens]MBG6289538.1 hypothetical protein [Pseudomonas nitroreducens]